MFALSDGPIFISQSDSEKAVNAGWGAETGTAELTAEAQGAADAIAEETGPTSGWGEPASGDASGWGEPASGDAPSGWDTPAADGEAAAAPKDDEAPRKRREEEEEDNTLTFDEYQSKKRADELAALPKLEGQRAVEQSEWKDAVQLMREEKEDVYFAGKVSIP